MNKLTKAGLAGGLGALLLLGGTTFALWTDSASVAGGTITSGNLEVAAGTVAWHDVSADVTGTPTSITLATYRIVPGDTIEGTFGLKGALDGDNLTADLALTLDGVAATGSLLDGLDITYQLFGADGITALSTSTALGSTATVAFRSPNNTATSVAALPTLPVDLPATDNLLVKVNVTFKTSTTDTDLTQATAELDDLGVTLSQTR
ncbi:MAG: alternate-type signal peptide domain-containing protein [Propionibacteriaceae bacterium]|jgi:alternate signal-mediated exported protein|nr:alternate-type signal peptide domain-containing protein [Propionibacteriaceae bacterium]